MWKTHDFQTFVYNKKSLKVLQGVDKIPFNTVLEEH